MMFSQTQKQQIESKINSVESKYDVQIVPIFLKSSHSYSRIPLLFSLGLGLIALSSHAAIVDSFSLLRSFNEVSYALVLSLFFAVIGYIIGHLPAIKRFSTSKAEKIENVYQKATQIYFEQGLQNIETHRTILVVLSKLERRVLILSDSGVSKYISQEKWDKIASKFESFIKASKSNTPLLGYLELISEIDKNLADHSELSLYSSKKDLNKKEDEISKIEESKEESDKNITINEAESETAESNIEMNDGDEVEDIQKDENKDKKESH